MATPSAQGQHAYDLPDLHRIGQLHGRYFSPSGDFAAIPDLLSERLLQRLDTLAMHPATVLDLGCTSDYQLNSLRQRFPDANILGACWSSSGLSRLSSTTTPAQARPLAGAWQPDTAVSESGLRRKLGRTLAGIGKLIPVRGFAASASKPWSVIAALPDQLPLPDNSFELVIASQVLPWCQDPGAVFKEMHRLLAPGGAFFWSGAGPDTLSEYRAIWQQVDHYPHVWGLRDMHDLGDDMLRCGFSAPVMDRENLTLEYVSVDALVADLRANALVNIAAGRRRGLMSREAVNRLRAAAASLSPDAGESIDVTFELIQGHGWKAEPPPVVENRDPTVFKVPIDAIARKSTQKFD